MEDSLEYIPGNGITRLYGHSSLSFVEVLLLIAIVDTPIYIPVQFVSGDTKSYIPITTTTIVILTQNNCHTLVCNPLLARVERQVAK